MFRPRNVAALALAVAAVTAAGVAAATRNAQSTQAAAADFSATTVSQTSSRTCTAADGTYQETTATYTGTSTSSDARLNGALVLRVHSMVNTTTQLGWLEGALRVRGTDTGATATIRGAIANGAAVGSVVGQTGRPGAKLVASFSAAFGQSSGFARQARLGKRERRGRPVRPRRLPQAGPRPPRPPCSTCGCDRARSCHACTVSTPRAAATSRST